MMMLLKLSFTYDRVKGGEGKDAEECRSQAGHCDVEWIASEYFRVETAYSFEC